MEIGSHICNFCWSNAGCDTRLTPQLISRHAALQKIEPTETKYGQSACRHFTCSSGGVAAAEDAKFRANYQTINTADGPVKAVTFGSEDKKTAGLRFIGEDGIIYSCEEKGGIYFKTGQRLDEFGQVHY